MTTTSSPTTRRRTPRKSPQRKVLRTWSFDSKGNRKYALQIQEASNGNPCLRIVEGVPQPDGTFRKFDLTFWSEDFAALFETLDAVRAHIRAEDIRTPAGHEWKARKAAQPYTKRDAAPGRNA
jgi:hypothetical protein